MVEEPVYIPSIEINIQQYDTLYTHANSPVQYKARAKRIETEWYYILDQNNLRYTVGVSQKKTAAIFIVLF